MILTSAPPPQWSHCCPGQWWRKPSWRHQQTWRTGRPWRRKPCGWRSQQLCGKYMSLINTRFNGGRCVRDLSARGVSHPCMPPVLQPCQRLSGLRRMPSLAKWISKQEILHTTFIVWAPKAQMHLVQFVSSIWTFKSHTVVVYLIPDNV